MLRLIKSKESPRRDDGPLYPEYWLVDVRHMCFTVTAVMARHIERALDNGPRQRWVSFVDIGGARVRVRTDVIVSLEQCSPESRANWRRFEEDRDKEKSPRERGW